MDKFVNGTDQTPFYRKKWFYILCVILTVAAIVLIVSIIAYSTTTPVKHTNKNMYEFLLGDKFISDSRNLTRLVSSDNRWELVNEDDWFYIKERGNGSVRFQPFGNIENILDMSQEFENNKYLLTLSSNDGPIIYDDSGTVIWSLNKIGATPTDHATQLLKNRAVDKMVIESGVDTESRLILYDENNNIICHYQITTDDAGPFALLYPNWYTDDNPSRS